MRCKNRDRGGGGAGAVVQAQILGLISYTCMRFGTYLRLLR